MLKGQLSLLPDVEVSGRTARLDDAAADVPPASLADGGDARWAALLEVLPDGFVALDRELRCTAVNAVGEAFLGLPRSQVLGRSCWDVVPRLAGGAEQRRIEQALTDRQRTAFEWCWSSTQRWFEVRCEPSPDDGLWILLCEVTARKAADAEQHRLLAEVEAERARLLGVLEQLPVGVLIASAPDAAIVHSNARLAELAGGRDAGEPFSPEGWTAHDAEGRRLEPAEWPVARALAEGVAIEGARLRVLSPEGRWAAVEASAAPVRDRHGRIVAAVGTFIDVTERERDAAEREALLRQIETERQKLATLLDRMPCGILLAEPGTGRLLYMNARGEELLGRPALPWNGAEEYASWGARRIDGEPCPLEELPPVKAALGREQAACDLVVARPDGQKLTLRMTAAPIEDGGSAHVLAAFVDVSAEIALAEERGQEQRFYELFVGMLGHDLRTPLSAILTSAEIIERTGPMVPAQARAAERIRRSSARMANMISQVLDLTRSRFGGIPVQRRTADLGDLCTRAADECSVAHQGRAITCDVEGSLEGAFDEERLLQLLGNLLDNAMKYGLSDAPIGLKAWSEADALLVEVHNHGRAIPPEQLPTLFDPFNRGEDGRRANGQGLGLGLYIARQIALAHGGDLRGYSDPRTGTTFTVWLPR